MPKRKKVSLYELTQEEFEEVLNAGAYKFQEMVDMWSEGKQALAALEETEQQREASYGFVKRYYMEFLLNHGQKKDISHNSQFFLYANANDVIGKIVGTSPNGAPVNLSEGYGCCSVSEEELTKTNDNLQMELAEAQQTIARLINLFQNINNLSYINGAAYSAIKTYVNLALKKETISSFPNCPTCKSDRTIAHPSKARTWLCIPCDKVFEEAE